MGLSETILAAMIGAIATVTTALFQLFMAFKARGKADVKPKKGTTLRSILAVLALMVASAAGGFLYSEFIKQRSAEDLRAMRQEMRELKELTAARIQEQQLRATAAVELPQPNAQLVTASSAAAGGSVESIVYVPACRRLGAGDISAPCGEGEAQRIALCGSIPSYARTHRIDRFAQPDAVQHAWDRHSAELEQDIGGARFTGRIFEYAQGADLKAVCTNFLQWSSDHPYIARIVVHYRVGDEAQPAAPAVDAEPAGASTPNVIAAEPLTGGTQNAAFVSSAAAP